VRLRATLGLEIPAGPRAPERRPWPGRAVGSPRDLAPARVPPAGDLTGVIGGGLVAACWLAPVAAIAYLATARPPPPPGPPPSPGGRAAARRALLARQVTRADGASARALLGPGRSEELAQRVESLARSRADVRRRGRRRARRIERDLHDGAQQRLVSLP